MFDFTHLYSLITQNAKLYWPNFTCCAIAFYTEDEVFLYGHPNFPDATNVPKDYQFTGADTVILYEDYPTCSSFLNAIKR